MRYAVTCFKRLFTFPAFWLSVAAVVVLCMFSELYYDPVSGDTETVIGMYLRYTGDVLLSDTAFCSYSVFTKGFSGWAVMFVPVIVSLAPIVICIDERKSGMWRSALHRAGRTRYSAGACLFILISGGLTLTFGYALFGAFAMAMFPHLSEFPIESAALFVETAFRQGSTMSAIYEASGLPLCAAAQLGVTFFYGAVCSATAMLLSSFCENKYVIICMPFFLKYALRQYSTALGYKAVEDPLNYNEKLEKFANLIYPDTALSFLNYSSIPTGAIILNAAFITLSAVLYCIIRVGRLKNEA